MVVGFSARIFTVNSYITQKDLKKVPNRKTELKVSEILLKDSKKDNEINKNHVQSINVIYDEKGKEAVILGKYSSQITVVSVYARKNNVYTYVGNLGVFYDVEEAMILNMAQRKENWVFLREKVKTAEEGFETVGFVRGYCFGKDDYNLIFSTSYSVLADKNLGLNNDECESLWERIAENGKVEFKMGSHPKIKVEKLQKYMTSKDKSLLGLPKAESYEEKEERTVVENYYWSDAYSHFIMEEVIDIRSGEEVAVIEKAINSPYIFTNKDYSDYNRILGKDGKADFVEVSSLILK